jgi:hypothetical protein
MDGLSARGWRNGEAELGYHQNQGYAARAAHRRVDQSADAGRRSPGNGHSLTNMTVFYSHLFVHLARFWHAVRALGAI